MQTNKNVQKLVSTQSHRSEGMPSSRQIRELLFLLERGAGRVLSVRKAPLQRRKFPARNENVNQSRVQAQTTPRTARLVSKHELKRTSRTNRCQRCSGDPQTRPGRPTHTREQQSITACRCERTPRTERLKVACKVGVLKSTKRKNIQQSANFTNVFCTSSISFYIFLRFTKTSITHEQLLQTAHPHTHCLPPVEKQRALSIQHNKIVRSMLLGCVQPMGSGWFCDGRSLLLLLCFILISHETHAQQMRLP